MAAASLDSIIQRVAAGLPIYGLFGMELLAADTERAVLRLNDGPQIRRPGGGVSGPILFAIADVSSWAFLIAHHGDEMAVTVNMSMQFLRPARRLPLLGTAVPLKSGRRLVTLEVRIAPEGQPEELVAQAVTTWALSR